MLIKEIFECTRCNLSGVKGRDREYYGGDCEKKIMLIFQNPGVPSELRQRKSTLEEEVNECREGFHKYWVLGKQKETFERFFKIFDRYGLIKMDKNYIKDKTYFKDLYITDVVKCHGKTKEIKGTQPCYAWLRNEIKLKEPKLIIAFSDKTLSFFNQFDIKKSNGHHALKGVV